MYYILAHDIGTTSCKSSIYQLTDVLTLCATGVADYSLRSAANGYAEQSETDWWDGICKATKEALDKLNLPGSAIHATAFSAQMQGLVLVDKSGNTVRKPISFMDCRAQHEITEHFYTGMIKFGRWNAKKLMNWLWITGVPAASVKDPLWKYLWVKKHEPEAFAAIHAWLDVKDYLVLKATGQFTMGRDSANATFLYDTRPHHEGWHEGLCQTFGVNLDHLPKVVPGTNQAGNLTAEAAKDLGLSAGIPVFAGGGDLTMIALGAGGTAPGKTHCYIGTSGWASTTTSKRLTDLKGMAGSILAAPPGLFNYISELETAGRCLEWVKNHLALDEIGVYLEDRGISDRLQLEKTLYQYLSSVVSETPAGAGGVIFTPWLHGSRSPFEDPFARGMFFNIGLQTKKRHLIRAVLEGVAYHLRWMLETLERKAPYNDTIAFVGGGAQSTAWAQILADITGRTVQVHADAQYAGTNGTALIVAAGLTGRNVDQSLSTIVIKHTLHPSPTLRAIYDKQFAVFKALAASNKKLFATLNQYEV